MAARKTVPQGVTLDASGYFQREGRRMVPVGANYWPGSAGVELWTRWPADEIQRDLDVLAGIGLNCIRFFLRWQDFEPQPGRYEAQQFTRLETLVSWCAERHILAHPSLFVGFMSGGVFWPEWREERNVFSDPFMVKRSAAFAGHCAAVLAPHHAALLALDQGNELCCLPDCRQAPPSAVIAWCGAVNAAIRKVYPHALIISGNEQGQVQGDPGWRLGQQPGTDLLSMHGYPVPAWHRIAFDGMTDPLCQTLLPYHVKAARAFAAVMLQEFGTIATFGPRQQDAYLRAVLPACWEAGANGFLWWCLRDIPIRDFPYVKHGFETTLGLVDAEGRVKPGLEYYLEFARSLPERPAPRALLAAPPAAPRLLRTARGRKTVEPPPAEAPAPAVASAEAPAPDAALASAAPSASAPPVCGLYWPRHYYPREDAWNPGNDPGSLARWMILAHYFLERLGLRVTIIRGDLPLPTDLRALVIAGARLGLDEAAALDAWVRAGGHVLWHGVDSRNWGQDYVDLLGAVPVDYRALRSVRVRFFGQTWDFGDFPAGTRVEVAPRTAEVLATDDRGLPQVLRHRREKGAVVYALPLVEEAIAKVSGDRIQRDRWQAWYAGAMG